MTIEAVGFVFSRSLLALVHRLGQSLPFSLQRSKLLSRSSTVRPASWRAWLSIIRRSSRCCHYTDCRSRSKLFWGFLVLVGAWNRSEICCRSLRYDERCADVQEGVERESCVLGSAVYHIPRDIWRPIPALNPSHEKSPSAVCFLY